MKIAYFCAEFALQSNLPTYAGGLGVLAADIIRQATENEIEFVGVGLYYSEGCSVCVQNKDGIIVEQCDWHPAVNSPELEPVTRPNGERLYIQIPIQDRDVLAQAWVWTKNGDVVYFLDTNIPTNIPSDRNITNRLYATDKEIRIKQEMILGIGGVRLLKALAISAQIYHSNDGHPAFLAFELIHNEMADKQVSLETALASVRDHIVFTNHTLVAAGNEVYSNDLVSTMFMKYANDIQIPLNDLVNLGLVQDSSIFSMTMLSLRASHKVSTVSALHAKKAAEIWTDHPMVQVTNGIHIQSWDAVQTDGGEGLWSAHQRQKKELLKIINTNRQAQWTEHMLIIGWARRIVAYKRPLAIVADIESFAKIARNTNMPIRLVFSGQPHPGDEEGLSLFKELLNLTQNRLADISVFLPDYNLDLARLLTSSCDIWLNTPVVGFEACGTSTMKAALNGVLPLTTKDGWLDEVDISGIGWTIETQNPGVSIREFLVNQIAPAYYQTITSRVGSEWLSRMELARKLIKDNFSTKRVLDDYIQKLYTAAIS